MMRDTEFRGKRVDGGEWVYGDKCYTKGDYYIIPQKTSGTIAPLLHKPEIIAIGFAIKVIPETVGQYTGLKDKDGVKIFEGDIIEHGGGDIMFVIWHSKDGGWCVDDKENIHCFDKLWRWVKVCRAIGDIHQNPELLTHAKGQ